MGENEMMQRIAALESKIKTLESQKYENMKQVAVDVIFRKYPNLDERYELLLETACLRTQIAETDTQFDVNRKIEEEFLSVCKKAKVEDPSNSTLDVHKWLEDRQKKEADEAKNAEELKKYMK